MSLNWNVSKIPNHEEVCFTIAEEDDRRSGIKKGDRRLKPETDALIWYTMATGVGWGINDQNVQEFIWRIRFWDKLEGPLVRTVDENGEWKDDPIPEDIIRQHIGLSTNVAYESRDEWLRRMFRATLNLSPGKDREPSQNTVDEDEDEDYELV